MAGWTAYPFSDRIRQLLVGTPFGAVFPPRAPIPLTAESARTHALRALRDYVNEVTFYRTMGPGFPPSPFQIERSRFLLEWPDSVEQDLFPRIVVMPGPMEANPVGLTVSVDEDTRDVFAPGTVLAIQHEHVERLTLQCWASTKSMRRAIAAGLEAVFSPTEERAGILFQLPHYFDQTARFTLVSRSHNDTEENARRRRMLDVMLDLQVNVVRLIRYAELTARAEVSTS